MREKRRALATTWTLSLVGASVPKRSGNAIPLLLPGRESIPNLPGGGPYQKLLE